MLLSVTITQAWSLYQLDISSASLYGDHEEHIFMENLQAMLLRGNHLRWVFYGGLFTSSRIIHALGSPSSLVFLWHFALCHVLQIRPCSQRRLRLILSFMQSILMADKMNPWGRSIHMEMCQKNSKLTNFEK